MKAPLTPLASLVKVKRYLLSGEVISEDELERLHVAAEEILDLTSKALDAIETDREVSCD